MSVAASDDFCYHILGIGIAAIAGAFTTDLSKVPDTAVLGQPSHELRLRQASFLSLSVLDLSNNNFGDGGMLALCRGLTHFLNGILDRNSGNRDGSFLGSRTFSSAVNLKVLKFDHNKCGDKAAACLAQFLESFYKPGFMPLEELSVSYNPIGVQGMKSTILVVDGF